MGCESVGCLHPHTFWPVKETWVTRTFLWFLAPLSSGVRGEEEWKGLDSPPDLNYLSRSLPYTKMCKITLSVSVCECVCVCVCVCERVSACVREWVCVCVSVCVCE